MGTVSISLILVPGLTKDVGPLAIGWLQQPKRTLHRGLHPSPCPSRMLTGAAPGSHRAPGACRVLPRLPDPHTGGLPRGRGGTGVVRSASGALAAYLRHAQHLPVARLREWHGGPWQRARSRPSADGWPRGRAPAPSNCGPRPQGIEFQRGQRGTAWCMAGADWSKTDSSRSWPDEV